MLVGRRYHFHLPGLVYILTTGVLVLGAINGQNNLLFLCFGFAVAGLVMSGLLSGAALMGIRVEREAVAPGVAGEPVFVRYRVHNRNRLFGAFAITVRELPGARFGRYRASWPGLITQPGVYVPYVAPGGSVSVVAAATALRRGTGELGPYEASSVFPFGLVRKSVLFHRPGGVLVRPRAARVRRGLFDVRGGRGTASPTPRPAASGGEEFFGLREFAPGDASRLIAWRSSARLDRVVVRQLSEMGSRRVWVVLSHDGLDAPTFEHAISAAAGAAALGLDEGVQVGLVTAEGMVLAPARGGSRHLAGILDALARISPAPPAVTSFQAPRAVRDRDGMVWIGASTILPPPWASGHARLLVDDRSDVELERASAAAPPLPGPPLTERVRRLAVRLFVPRREGAP